MLEGIGLGIVVEVTVAPSALVKFLEAARILDYPVERDEG
jgi:hypothetical protein